MSVVLQAQLSLTTWLLIGASLQSILFVSLPRRVALLPAILLLAARFIHNALITKGYIHNPYMNGVRKGKWTSQIPNEDGSFPEKMAGKNIVMFVVGARSNHPMGLLAPGFKEMGDHNRNMWKEAEANKTKYGFLGKSTVLIAAGGPAKNSLLHLSYWKDAASLSAFAQGPAHRLGWDWWNKTIKAHPHLGIMHELYESPIGNWENVVVNFPPVGLGETKHLVQGKESDEADRWISPLVEARGAKFKSMMSRMGQREITPI